MFYTDRCDLQEPNKSVTQVFSVMIAAMANDSGRCAMGPNPLNPQPQGLGFRV